MGGGILPIFLITLASACAVRENDNRSKFLIVTAPQISQKVNEKDVQVDSDGLQTQGLQTSSFYYFQNNNNDSSHLKNFPNFDDQIHHSNDLNIDYSKNIQGKTNDALAAKLRTIPQENTQESVIYHSLDLPIKQAEMMVRENYSPKQIPSNPNFLGYRIENPSNKMTSYLYVPEVKIPNSYSGNVGKTSNKVERVEQLYETNNHNQQNIVSYSFKYPLSHLATKARNTYKNIFDSTEGFRPEQSLGFVSNFEFRPEQRKIIQNFFSPYRKHFIITSHQQDNHEQSDSVNSNVITREEMTPQPSEKYEAHHETYADTYPEKEGGQTYHSFHPKVKPNKKEIHYHQHKHLHDHDHDQKHSHKHQSGHHHGHGHQHANKQVHSHSHKNDHWHDHHEKNEHLHHSEHTHGHHGHHDHKHGEDHVHKQHSDHHHRHESHHDHHEDHWGKHSHKHHSHHDHHHDHGHKHHSKHGHRHSEKHGHKHHHKHSGKY